MQIAPVLSGRVFSNLGLPLSGARIYTYVGGSFTTPAVTYSNAEGSAARTNPVVCDSSGLVPPIFIEPNVSYNFLLTDSGDTPIQSFENITVASGAPIV